MKKRLLSALLALCMVLTLLPTNAWADFTLVDGAIQGQVYGAASGTEEPVGETVNVAVYAQSDLNTALATCTTDSEGVFTLTRDGGFPAGNYTVVLTSNLYLTERKEISISSDNSGYTFARIDLVVLGKVYGTVTDADTGIALSGVKVEAYRDSMLIGSTTTDASGAYSLEGERGTCQLVFTKDGYDNKTVDTNLSGPLSWELVDVEMTSTGGGTGEGENPGGGDNPGGDTQEEMTWTLIDGVLTISGKGVPIPDYDYRNSPPWESFHDDIRTVIIEDGITRIGTEAFDGCSNLSSVIIPDTVTSIGAYAFCVCGSLTSVTIPDSVTSIGDYVFNSCSSLTSVIIPNGVTGIGDYAFESCRSLTSVTIPDSVATIGRSAFGGCTSLTSITIPDSVTSIGYEAFSGCGSLTNVTISDGVTSIGGSAFLGCRSLTSVTIPDSVTSIGSQAFRESGLTSVTISNSVTRIEGWTFGYCGLTTVTIPDGVTSIGGNAFYSCSRLTSVTIPNSVTSIENGAFSGFGLGHSLTDVYYSGSETDWAAIDISFSSNGWLTDATIHYNSTGPSSGSEDSDHFYETEKPVTDVKSLLNSYVSDWNTAYTKFAEAVDKALQASATTSSAKRDEVIQSQKLAMMEADEKAGSRDSRYISGSVFPDDEIKSAAYEALSTFLYDHIYSAIDLSKVSAEDINGSKLVTTVLNGIRSDSETYQIGHVKVAITTSGFGNVSFGMLTCTSQLIAGRYTYGICSSTAKCEQAIRAYMRELVGLETSALYQVYSAVCKDVLGQSLDKLTEKYLSQKLQPYISKFVPAKVGNLLANLNSCYNYYQYIKKMMGWATSTDTPENILAAMQGFEFKDDSIQDSATKKAWKNLKKAALNLNDAYMCYLSGTLDESKLATWWNSTVDWWNDTAATLKAIFSCPVNVSVYDSSGQQIGYVGDDDIWYTEGLIYIEEKGDAKIVYSFIDDVISFQVSATDYGTLGCAFETYDNEGHPIGRTNYYDIPLYPNKNLSVQGSQNEGDLSYTISTNGGVIEADEYILSSQNASVSISCNATTGGVVYGDGTYVRGDAVVLLAEPEDDNRFVGWYQGDDLMCTSRIYEFTAKENVEVSAVFSASVTEELESVYSIKFDANDGTENITTMTTDADGTLSSLPVPTRNGYTFDGWYTAAVGGTKVTTETVFTKDTIIYAHWTKNQTPPTPSDGSSSGSSSGDSSSSGETSGSDSTGGGTSNGGASGSGSSGHSSGGSSSSGNTSSALAKKPSGSTEGTTDTTPSTPSGIFSDVPSNHTFAAAIAWVRDNGIMSGYSDGTFRPNNSTNRQQMWMVLARMAGANPTNMTEARTWAVNSGISDGTNPENPMSRQQLVTMLYRFAQSQGVNISNSADLSVYPDNGVVASYATEALAWAVGNGIVTGTTDGRLNPEGTATRAHFAAFIYRYANLNLTATALSDMGPDYSEG